MNVVLTLWITCLIWSSVWLFIKLGVTDLPPFTFAGLRLITAVAVLVPFILIRRVPPRGWRDWRMMIVTGLILFGLNYGLILWGAQYISSGLVAVLQATTPAFSLLFGGFFQRQERFTIAKFAAIALGIAGVAIIFSDQVRLSGVDAFLGSLAVAASAMCVAVAYLIVKTGTEVKPSVLMAGQQFFGAVPLLILGIWNEGNPLELRWSTAANEQRRAPRYHKRRLQMAGVRVLQRQLGTTCTLPRNPSADYSGYRIKLGSLRQHLGACSEPSSRTP